jgi:phospholipid/cholesterol/gamma-HCH transport system permease protein
VGDDLARAVLGALPVPTLVAPRAIACALAVPFLTVAIDAAAVRFGSASTLATTGTRGSADFAARSSGVSCNSAGFINAQ